MLTDMREVFQDGALHGEFVEVSVEEGEDAIGRVMVRPMVAVRHGHNVSHSCEIRGCGLNQGYLTKVRCVRMSKT